MSSPGGHDAGWWLSQSKLVDHLDDLVMCPVPDMPNDVIGAGERRLIGTWPRVGSF
jgi:hypothetical protein